jgi:hypothetical protein
MVRYSRRRGLTIPLIAFALAAASSAGAQLVVFNNFGPGDTYDTTTGLTEGVMGVIQGVQFVPSASGKLDKIELALSLVQGTNSALVYLVGDSSGQPDTGNVLEIWTTTSMGPIGSNNPLLVFPSVWHHMLSNGTPYWIYVDTNLSFSTVATWNQNTTNGMGMWAQRANSLTPWSVQNQTQGAFRVTVQGPGSATPVPAAPVVSAIGAAVYGVCFFRKRRTA